MKRAIFIFSILSALILFIIPVLYSLSASCEAVGDIRFLQAYSASDEFLPVGNSYQADLVVIGPVAGTDGRRFNFTLTFTELSGDSSLGSILVLLPDHHGSEGFRSFRLNSEDSRATNDKKWEGRITENHGKYFINLKAKAADDYLGRNETVTVSFSATVPVGDKTGTYEFKTRAWTDNSLRDSMRTNPENGHPENLNLMASGHSDPAIYIDLPKKTGNDTYSFINNRAAGLKAELQAEGTGFQTTVYSTLHSVSFLTRLNLPAAHTYTTTFHQPAGEGRWETGKIAENKPVDLLQGYIIGWRSYYHRVSNPGTHEIFSSMADMLKAQGEFKNRDLSGLNETELKALAHGESVSYYRTELTPLTEQVWFAGVAVDPGESGVLIKKINSSYGSTAYMFNENGDLWPSESGYGGPDYGFGFVRDGDGYRIERGIDYPGSSIDIEQVADASRGKVVRYINVSSPYSGSFLKENMIVSGSGKVEEILNNINIEPGAFLDWPGSASFSDDWDFWFFPDNTTSSAVFDTPHLGAEDTGSVAPASEITSEEESLSDAVISESEPELTGALNDDEQGNSSVEVSLVGSMADRVNDRISVEPGVENAMEYAASFYRDTNYTAIVVLTVIAFLIFITASAIAVIIVRNRY